MWAVPSVADLRDRTLPRGLEPAAVKQAAGQLRSAHGWSAGATTRSCCCCRGWGCAPARSPRSGSTTSTGGPGAARPRQGQPPGRAAVAGRCRRGDRVLSSPPPAVRVPGAVPAGDRAAPRAEPKHDRRGSSARRATGPGCRGSGAHRLRHTAATEMLRAGASLAEIGQVLRHREQKTTAIYAKVDRNALRALARPWPSPGRCGMTALREALGDYLRHPPPARVRDAPGRPPAGRVRRASSSRRAPSGSPPSWR